MKCKKSTIERVERECGSDIGAYRYVLEYGVMGRAKIVRRKRSELNVMPRYGSGWETVAEYDPNTGWAIT